MRSVQSWLDEYGESHQHPANKAIHWICVPLIVLSLVSLLWELPIPERFIEISPLMNWGTLFLLTALVYYFVLSISLAFGMVAVTGALILATHWLDGLALPLWQLALAIFVGAWIGQFIGHRIEGRKPSFLKDLQFLMIGPLWLLAQVYRWMRVPY
jgi:uncharacterized membrane protein YGL010W